MKAVLSQFLIPLLVVVLVVCATWFWFDKMEKRWVVHNSLSEAATNNPMLAASRLLEQHRHTVTAENTLGVVLLRSLSRGTLILVSNAGVMTSPQVDHLLDWVAQGNTLIASPTLVREIDNTDQEQQKPDAARPGRAAVDAGKTVDSLGRRFGMVQLRSIQGERQGKFCRKPWMPYQPEPSDSDAELAPVDCLATLTFPGVAYPLRLDVSGSVLAQRNRTPETTDIPDMLFGDEQGQAVRVFAHGKGHMVFVGHNYFSNANLGLFDHADLLLALADLNRDARSVLIVQRLDIPSWYQALWSMFSYTIVGLALFLLLLAWAAVRRFGPLLPEPNETRRALMEHVDVSGRWLWKSEKGRTVLLEAVRQATEKILARRAPELNKLPSAQKNQDLALKCQLSPADLADALQEPAASLPIEFTRQIQTLQRLRKHYEHSER